METGKLAQLFPAFKGEERVISPTQSVGDIMRELKASHIYFAADYDNVARGYLRKTVHEICVELFYDCKKLTNYKEEPAALQTTRSPGTFLFVGKTVGADCKHYAGYVSGVLDAVSRLTGVYIDWVYRFAAYNNKDEYGHVFVVVNPGADDELWVDPVLSKLDQRFPFPTKFKDKKVTMLKRISGVDYAFKNTNVVSRYGKTMGDTPTGILTDGGSGLVNAGLDAVLPGASAAVNTVISKLPASGFTGFLSGFLKDPLGTIVSLVKGRTYTIGDYKLAEVYMRNILGNMQIQSWEQVPDTFVPQAWAFFTAATGVRIHSYDDLNALAGYANTPEERAANYLKRDPGWTPDISLAAATRAAYLLGEPGYGGVFSIYQNRDIKWPMSVFTALPYVYPIPSLAINILYTGIMPTDNSRIVNGYPDTYTGVRYVSQVSKTVQTNVPAPPGGSLTPSTTQTNTGSSSSAGPSGNINKAGLFTGNAAPLLLGGTLLVLGVANSGKQKRGKKMSGVRSSKKDNKVALVGLGLVAAIAIAKSAAKKNAPDSSPANPPAIKTTDFVAPQVLPASVSLDSSPALLGDYTNTAVPASAIKNPTGSGGYAFSPEIVKDSNDRTVAVSPDNISGVTPQVFFG